jgi:hypothetical protein
MIRSAGGMWHQCRLDCSSAQMSHTVSLHFVCSGLVKMLQYCVSHQSNVSSHMLPNLVISELNDHETLAFQCSAKPWLPPLTIDPAIKCWCLLTRSNVDGQAIRGTTCQTDNNRPDCDVIDENLVHCPFAEHRPGNYLEIQANPTLEISRRCGSHRSGRIQMNKRLESHERLRLPSTSVFVTRQHVNHPDSHHCT